MDFDVEALRQGAIYFIVMIASLALHEWGHAVMADKLDGMLDIGSHAMQAVRRILNDLRPGVLDHLGLWAALEALLVDFQQRNKLRCHLDCEAYVERCRLGREAEIAVYRIVQEVLTNITRHARATSVTLAAFAVGRDLQIEVADDGCGMSVPNQPTSFGLLGMQERARAIGGELAIHSEPEKGTTVRLLIRGAFAT